MRISPIQLLHIHYTLARTLIEITELRNKEQAVPARVPVVHHPVQVADAAAVKISKDFLSYCTVAATHDSAHFPCSERSDQ